MTSKPRPLRGSLAIALFIVSVSICMFFVLLRPAASHDALPTPTKPLGWAYPFACCANYDCRQMHSGEVLERPEGYVISGTGEVIPMSDRRVRQSPDGEFHWCAHQSGLDAGKTICLFVPPRSF